MVRLQEGKSQFFLTIHKKLVKAKGWKKGTEIDELLNSDGDIVLKEQGDKE